MSKKLLKYNPLRVLRQAIALICLSLLFVTFADWGNGTPTIDALREVGSSLARWQFLPAVLSIGATTVLVILVLTLFFGRIYCSTLCPLGVAQDVVSGIRGRKQKSLATRFSFHSANKLLRYAILSLTILGIAIGAGAMVAFVDPYSIFGRIVYDGLRPVVQALNNMLALTVGDSFGRETITVSWLSSVFSLAMMAIIGYLAWHRGRLYCNSFCPVGTLLGEVSRISLFKFQIDTNKCNSCGLCARKCKSECIDPKSHTIDASRCVVCFDCVDNCSQQAISFSVTDIAKANSEAKSSSSKANAKLDSADISRKKFLGAITTAAALSATDALAQGGNKHHRQNGASRAVAPPGAGSLDNLHKKCTGCHLCISKCPPHVLQPAVGEYGLEGIMQPVMRFDKGYCLYDCNLCGQVCPTGAIELLHPEQKKMTFIGHAIIDRERCIITTDQVECGNCAQHCPAEAIKMVRSPIDYRSYPELEKALCIGCGRCEYLCPATPIKAIRVKGYKQHK